MAPSDEYLLELEQTITRLKGECDCGQRRIASDQKLITEITAKIARLRDDNERLREERRQQKKED